MTSTTSTARTSTGRTIGPSSRAEDASQESQLKVVLRRFMRHRLAVISSALLLVIFVASLLAPVITTFPRDEIDVSSSQRPAPPGTVSADGRVHILGIDHLGRDLFTRVLYAARVSLTIAILVVLLSESFGMMLGAIAGFYGGRTDMLLSRINEFMLTIPQLPILLIISAILLKRDVVLPLPGFVNKMLSALMLAPEREAQKVVVLVLILVIFGWLGILPPDARHGADAQQAGLRRGAARRRARPMPASSSVTSSPTAWRPSWSTPA